MAVREEFRVHGYAALKMKKGKPPKIPTFPVTKKQVDPDMWAVALELADGDVKRITIVSETEAIVK